MQIICTSLQADNLASYSTLNFLQAGCFVFELKKLWNSSHEYVLLAVLMMYQVPGYTRRMEREWYYSEKVQHLLSDYMAKCVLPIDLCTTLTYLAVRFASSTSDVVFLTGGLKL